MKKFTKIPIESNTLNKDVALNDSNEELIKEILIITDQDFNLNYDIYHNKDHQKSYLKVNVISLKKAVCQIKARAVISNDAKDCDSEIKIESFILEESSVEATPILEINFNEVSAKHAFSTNYLENSQITYLRSKGLNNDQIYKLILKARYKIDLDKISLNKGIYYAER